MQAQGLAQDRQHHQNAQKACHHQHQSGQDGEQPHDKEQLDRYTLIRNNLLSEKHHQKTEIQSCRNFKSKYPEIELCSLEEFLANEAHKEYESTADEHALYLQRLSFELAERERLCKLLEEKQGREKELAENIASKKKFLQSLGSLLKGVKKATQPMQERFVMHHTWQAKQGKLARLNL